MAIKQINLHKRHEFQSQFDDAKGTPEATTFVLRELDTFLTAHVSDLMTKLTFEGGEQEMSISDFSSVSVLACQLALVDVVNFQDESGAPVPFRTQKKNVKGRTYDVAHDDFIRSVPMTILTEMFGHIQTMNSVTADEAKNSATP